MMPPEAEAIEARAQPVPLEVPSETRLQKKKNKQHKRGRGRAPLNVVLARLDYFQDICYRNQAGYCFC